MSTDTVEERIQDSPTAHGFGTWTSQTRAFAVRCLRELFRNKTVLFWTIAFPTGFYLLTIALFIPTEEIPEAAMAYVRAGTAVMYGTFGAIIAGLNAFGQQLAMDLEDRRYQLYRSLPIAPSADLAGRMLPGAALAFVAVVVVLAVSAATGGTFSLSSTASLPAVVVALLGLTVFWMVVAVLVTALVRDTRYASIITVSPALGLYFLTGFNGGDPGAFQGPDYLLNWLPNTLPTRLVGDHLARAPAELTEPGVLGPPDTVVGTATVVLYAALVLVVGILVMRRVIYGRGVVP